MSINFDKNKKYIILSVLVLAVLFIFVKFAFLSGKEEIESVRTREYTVQKGDITVGVETSGVIKTGGNIHTFEENTVVEDIFVKEGSEVKKGDKIASVSIEKLDELIQSVKDQISDANAMLLQAQGNKNITLEENKKNNQDSVDRINKDFSEKKNALLKQITDLENIIKENGDKFEKISREVKQLTEETAQINNEIGEIQKKTDENILKIGKLKEQLISEKNEDEKNKILLEITKTENENTQLNRQLQTLKESPSLKLLAEKSQQETEIKASLDNDSLLLSQKKQELSELENKYQSDLQEQNKDNQFNDYKSQQQAKSYDENISKYQKQISQMQNKLNNLLNIRKNPVLYANLDGIVTSINYKKGDTISDSNPFCIVGDVEKTSISVPISAVDINNVEVGQKVNIYIDAFAQEKFTGTVIERLLVANENGDYTVNIEVDGGDFNLLPGMKAYATIILKEKTNILTLSNKAVFLENGQQYVNLKNEDGTLEKRKIITGFSDGRVSEVLDGLNENDIAAVME